MITEKEMRQWIDQASYVQLLKRWRFASTISPWTEGNLGQYFKEELFKKKDALSPEEQIAASKAVGW